MTTSDLRLSLAHPTPAPVSAPTITADQLALIKQTIAKDATPLELELYFFDCARRGVNPLDKLIHFTKRGGKYTPVTSIDFMRSRAAGTGDYAGQEDAIFSGTVGAADFAATVTVFRLVKSQRCDFTATARWSEYEPDQDFMWRKMPHTMLGKCAEALALRKGFPQELSGLYEAAELEQAERQQVDQGTGEIIEAAPRLITDAQRKRLFAIAKKAGWTKDAMKQALMERCQVESTSAIPATQYDDICAMFAETAPMADPNDTPF